MFVIANKSPIKGYPVIMAGNGNGDAVTWLIIN